MGNVDTKLNFRKAIVQLGTKNQVSKIYRNHHSTRSVGIGKYRSCGFPHALYASYGGLNCQNVRTTMVVITDVFFQNLI